MVLSDGCYWNCPAETLVEKADSGNKGLSAEVAGNRTAEIAKEGLLQAEPSVGISYLCLIPVIGR